VPKTKIDLDEYAKTKLESLDSDTLEDYNQALDAQIQVLRGRKREVAGQLSVRQAEMDLAPILENLTPEQRKALAQRTILAPKGIESQESHGTPGKSDDSEE